MDAIEHVHDGTEVFDSRGESIGKVREVRMGDPEAATGEGQSMPGSPMSDLFRGLFSSSPDISPEQAERLVRVGYLQIDRPLFERDAYVASDSIDRVDGDSVHLNIVVE
ncbi:MAG: hypothetical protein KIT89_05705 [Microcella sp.]|uniref:hypothetical protein n=1 Tax=Microcella sp. TaxID=1913979 RepID=UPI0024CA8C1A|nr:hypothetical protein [Microcella sp.]UYN84662.1 MAG: hypothetical protein KIT89_05705 [Microcella sp.]